MNRKQLGRIQKVMVGLGGYQDAHLGIGFVLGGEGWGVHTPFLGAWSPSHFKAGGAQWTEAERTELLAKAMRKLDEILHAAKKTDVSQLTGIPVEAEFNGNQLVDWRVLKEVL